MNVGHDVNLTDTDSLRSRMPKQDRARPEGERRRTSAPSESAVRYGKQAARKKSRFSLDVVSLLQPALHRWPWLFVGLLLGAGAGFGIGTLLWHMTFSASVQLVRYDAPVARDSFQPRPIDTGTLLGRLGADPVFLRHVGQLLSPPLSAGQVLSHMKANPERNTNILTISATGTDAGEMTNLANVFSRETVAYTQQLQAQEATEAIGYIEKDLQETESQLAEAKKNMPTVAPGSKQSDVVVAGDTLETDKNKEQITAAKEELTKLLAKYTDAHPLVRQQRATIAALEAEAATGVSAAKAAKAAKDGSNASAQPTEGKRIVSRDEFEVSLFRVRELESLRMQLLYRKQQLEIFRTNAPGGFRITVPASGDTLTVHRPWVKIALLAAFGAILGLTFTSGQILFREFVDSRLKTAEDAERVTGLPVIATLGDLRQMSLAQRDDWAFRTWIALQDRLAFSPNHGLICGITSSRVGDGRSTWIGLLAGAARKCGFRVLTIATKPTADAAINAQEAAEAAAAANLAKESAAQPIHDAVPVNGGAAANGAHVVDGVAAKATAKPAAMNGSGRIPAAVVPRAAAVEPLRGVSADSEFTAMTASVLFTPAQVTEKLMGPETDPLVHIPLPGWTWNLERRKQWQGALSVWRKIENVVILVELPPASQPEAVLLASNLPNILWLVESNKSEAAETQAQLQTLRHARCNLVGSVINRAMSTLTNGKLARWMACFTVFLALGLTSTQLRAQTETTTEPAATPAAFSVTSARQRADWQKKLTLGPGDVLTVGLYGEPDLTLKEAPISPDGRFSYLEATDVMAAGLTVDELRDKLNEALGKFRREPQVIVSPVAFKSKKYFVLGKVSKRGVFTLDRPITLLEAVARAQGMETGMSSDRTLIELADLSHSFVARHGQKLNVDFERLFQQGDLTQNIALEPDDYIYFPASEMKEVYVLGAVTRPGPYAYTTATGALGAIAARSGFDEYAWKKRVLVIRGSIQHPQTFVVNADDILSGRARDLKLEPHDIVYVSKRPWWRAEDLLDEAASAFVTSAVVVWTGIHVDDQLLHR